MSARRAQLPAAGPQSASRRSRGVNGGDELHRGRHQAVRLQVACDLLGISKRTGERLLAEGRFPVPELPRLAKKRGSPHLFSTADIDRYLFRGSTADAVVGGW
jgi:hypothetical protein